MKGETPAPIPADNKDTFNKFDASTWPSTAQKLDAVLTEMEHLVETADDAQLAKWRLRRHRPAHLRPAQQRMPTTSARSSTSANSRAPGTPTKASSNSAGNLAPGTWVSYTLPTPTLTTEARHAVLTLKSRFAGNVYIIQCARQRALRSALKPANS